jgi:hypothetical protein
LVLGAVAILILAAVALVVALTAKTTGGLLDSGPATATIRITLPASGSGQPSFSGTLGGEPLTGTVANDSSSSTGSGSGSIAIGFRYQGSLGGTGYVLHVSADLQGGAQGLQTGQITFKVTGNYGAEPVTGTAEFELLPSSATSKSLTVPFNGRVGKQPLVGVATATEDGAHAISVTARLTVLPSST